MKLQAVPADLDIELLEPLLREFVALVGLQSTMLIVGKWGGLHIYVAKDPGPESELSQLIGLEQARLIGASRFGGDRPAIPKAGQALRYLRDHQIRADHATKSIRTLVQEYKLSERRICEILAAGEPDFGPLFGDQP